MQLIDLRTVQDIGPNDIQGIVQLDAIYGPAGRRIITDNCQTHLCFSGVGYEDAQWFSGTLGEQTVIARSASAGRHRDDILAGQGGRTRSETARPLLTASELMELPHRVVVVRPRHARPFMARVSWRLSWRTRRLVARANSAARADGMEGMDRDAQTPHNPEQARGSTPAVEGKKVEGAA